LGELQQMKTGESDNKELMQLFGDVNMLSFVRVSVELDWSC